MSAGTGTNPAQESIDLANGTQSPFRRFASSDRLLEFERGGSPSDDLGYFGPDSVTWRIHAHPIVVVGGFRALMIQALHPLAMAGVAQHSDYAKNPLNRFRRTAQFMHHVVYSDTQTARDAAAHVHKVHEYIRGVDPVTGRNYDANDPELLLWVHCVAAHSCITAYDSFVREIDPAERDRFFAEQVARAELVGVPRELVPDSAAAYREYFDAHAAESLPEPRRRRHDPLRLEAEHAAGQAQRLAVRDQLEVRRPRRGHPGAALDPPDRRSAQARSARLGAGQDRLREREGA